MSRDQNHSHFQQRNLVGKLEPANMLNEVNYRRHGFDGRGAALSSLDLSRPSMGLDHRVPSLNLDRRDLDRRGTVPPRPSSMLSDGGSATSLESSPRFVKFFITIIIVIFVQFFITIIIAIISASPGTKRRAALRIELQLLRRRNMRRALMRLVLLQFCLWFRGKGSINFFSGDGQHLGREPLLQHLQPQFHRHSRLCEPRKAPLRRAWQDEQ